jgi:thymidylate synthase
MAVSYQSQYARILNELIENPLKKRPSRIGDIHGRFVEIMRVDLQEEFPLMDIKKIQFSNIMHELLWFIAGDTHIKYLIENGCNIWTDDAYRYYKEKQESMKAEYIKIYGDGADVDGKKPNDKFKPLDKETFIELAKKEKNRWGELGRVYGKQWREFNGQTDQLQNCINTLLKNPDDRRMIVVAHNPTDIENGIVGLPSCHNMFQFHTVPLSFEERLAIKKERFPIDTQELDTEEKLDRYGIPKFYLNLWFNIRSNDFFLGQPYNMASYALLVHIIANIVNMIPKEVVCTAIDCHLYDVHFEAAQEYLRRYYKLLEDNYIGKNVNLLNENDITFCKAKLNIKRKLTSIDDVNANDIELINYYPQSYIKAPLLT